MLSDCKTALSCLFIQDSSRIDAGYKHPAKQGARGKLIKIINKSHKKRLIWQGYVLTKFLGITTLRSCFMLQYRCKATSFKEV
jgi:hypothetical protein